MWTVYRRIAELWCQQKKQPLTKEERKEFEQCLDAHMNLARKLANLENLSLVASIENNVEWQHEICASIDNIHNQMIGMPYDENKKKSKKKS